MPTNVHINAPPSVVYLLKNNLYINLTNRCPCSCTFCIRKSTGTVGSATNLWLEHDPTADEVIQELKKHDLTKFNEIVFCGYGEPFCAFPVMLKTCRYLKTFSAKIRINTNGLANLISQSSLMHREDFLFKTQLGQPVISFFRGLVDTISISLNSSTPQKYLDLCRPQFGISSFNEVLKFAQEAKNCIPFVFFSVVDIIGKDEIEDCKKLVQGLGIPLRVREFI